MCGIILVVYGRAKAAVETVSVKTACQTGAQMIIRTPSGEQRMTMTEMMSPSSGVAVGSIWECCQSPDANHQMLPILSADGAMIWALMPNRDARDRDRSLWLKLAAALAWRCGSPRDRCGGALASAKSAKR